VGWAFVPHPFIMRIAEYSFMTDDGSGFVIQSIDNTVNICYIK